MLSVPSSVLLAIEAVIVVGLNSSGARLQAGEIAAELAVERRALEFVLRKLTQADILESVRGPNGGYVLARERRRISLASIARAVSENGEAGEPGDNRLSPLRRNVTRVMLREFEDQFLERLDGLTVETACHRAQTAGIGKALDAVADYTI